MTEPGARVYAIRDANDTTIHAYGPGTYLGDHVMPALLTPDLHQQAESAIRRGDARRDDLPGPKTFYDQRVVDGKMGRAEADAAIQHAIEHAQAERARPIADRAHDLAVELAKNPLIELDSGGQVWGCQCWWGELEGDQIPDQFVGGREVVLVSAGDDPNPKEN